MSESENDVTSEERNNYVERAHESLMKCAKDGDCENCERESTCFRGIKAVLANLVVDVNDVRHEVEEVKHYFLDERSKRRAEKGNDIFDKGLKAVMLVIVLFQCIFLLINFYGIFK